MYFADDCETLINSTTCPSHRDANKSQTDKGVTSLVLYDSSFMYNYLPLSDISGSNLS